VPNEEPKLTLSAASASNSDAASTAVSASPSPPPQVEPTPAIELILMRLTDFAHSLGKMEGMLSRALSVAKTHGDRLKTLEEHASYHAERLTILEANAKAERAELDAVRSVQSSHGVRITNMENKNTHSSGWKSGMWAAITVGASIGSGLVAVLVKAALDGKLTGGTH
jgi:hypothetical protein